MATLEESYQYCRQVARTQARNFYYSFLLLPNQKRDAMCVMYAFMRYCDDLSDAESGAEQEAVETSLRQWREEMVEALQGRYASHPVWPAFHDVVQRYRIPHAYFHDMIDGVASDATQRQFLTFDELYRYCYQVASVVGLTTVHIFEFESASALALAEKCGIAFQITNILRDVREDAERGRVYLPAEDLARFSVGVEQLRHGMSDQPFRELMRFEADRARRYYQESMPLIGMVHRSSRSALWALIEIYSRLLRRIEKCNFNVLEQRVSLPTWEKVGILLSAPVASTRLPN